MRFTRHLLVDFRCCVGKAALMHSESCPLLPFRIPLTSTRFLNYACNFKGRVPNQGGLSTQWKIELSGCVEPLLLRYPGTAQSFSKRQTLWYQTSTDLSVIVSLGCPNTEFLFPLLFCLFICMLWSTVTLTYVCQNCHFLNHFCLFGYFKLVFHQHLILRRVSAFFFLSLDS